MSLWIRQSFLLSLCLARVSCQAVAPQAYTAPADCPPTDFFNAGNLSCTSCGANSVQQQTQSVSCVCSPGYIRDTTTNTCVSCSNSQAVPSRDGLFCLQCLPPLMFDSATMSCTGCDSTQYYIDNLPSTQNQLGNRTCVSCPQGLWAGLDQASCIPCGVSDCSQCAAANVAGGVCFIPPLSTPSVQPSFAFYNAHYSAALQLCQNGNATACQLVLNLCVLQSYDRQDPACSQSINLASTQANLVPPIYYPEFGADEYLKTTIIQTQFSTRDGSRFQLLASQFSLNGTFLGLINVSNEIMLCSERESRAASAWKVAVKYELQCTINSETLGQIGNSPTFIDLFLRDGDQLVPVPLLIENYRDNTGSAVNEGGDVLRWQFTRRMFLSQSITSTPVYADRMEVRFVLRSTGGIEPPYIRVRYQAIPTTQTTVPASFAVTYEQIGFGFNIGLASVAAALLLVVGVHTGFKTNGFMRRNGTTFCDLSTLLYLGTELSASYSTILFILLVCAGSFWFVFFKAQIIIFLALPIRIQEVTFIVILVLACFLRMIQIVYLLWRQISVDVFFIDWEKPKTISSVTHPSTANGGTVPASVSIWRTYFLANEWNEIQSFRKISPTFVLLAVLFFLEVVGLKHLAENSPAAYVTTSDERYSSPHSIVLRFVIAAVLFTVIAGLMRLFIVLIYERFIEHKIRQFVDLCSVSNVSVLVMSHNLFGYYVHGRSVHGNADVNMRQMNYNLTKEQEDLCGQRGLLADSDEQVYEIAVSRIFREKYNTILQPILAERAEVQPVGRQGGRRTVAIGSPVTEVMLQVHEEMSHFLSSFIDHGVPDCDYVPKTKLLLEKILGMEFYDPVERSLFYADPGYSFTETLFYGHEWSLLSLEVLLFAVVDLAAQNYVLAAVITFAVTKVLALIRNGLGKRNLGRKTLVDDRFLI